MVSRKSIPALAKACSLLPTHRWMSDLQSSRKSRRTSLPARCLLLAGLLSVIGTIGAAAADDVASKTDTAKTREEMQKALNQEVMSTPFNSGDIKKAETYAQEAKKNNVAPVPQPPTYWVPGWTCFNLTAYRYYRYLDYQNCVYYHLYYGRYW